MISVFAVMCFVGICCALTLAESHGLELWKEMSLPQTSTIRADWSTAGEKHRGKCMINTFKSFMLNSIISVIHHSHLYWDYAANIRMLWPEHTHTHTLCCQRWSRLAGRSDWSWLCGGWNSVWSVNDVSGQEVSPYSVSEPELLSHRTQRTHLFQSWGENIPDCTGLLSKIPFPKSMSRYN